MYLRDHDDGGFNYSNLNHSIQFPVLIIHVLGKDKNMSTHGTKHTCELHVPALFPCFSWLFSGSVTMSKSAEPTSYYTPIGQHPKRT